MAADLSALCEAIAHNLKPLLPDMQVHAYMLANPSPPAVMVEVDNEDYDQTFGRGLEVLFFRVWAIVPFSDDIGSQMKLHEMMKPTGDTSIKALLESDRTLGGLGKLTVPSRTGTRLYTRGTQGPYLGAEWTVKVWAGGR